MGQTILLFDIQKEKRQAVLQIAKELTIEIIDVPARDYGKTLGHLAGIKGFEQCPAGEKTHSAFPMEMLIFSGMDSERVDAFLAAYKQIGLAPVPLKAVLTPHNISWSADQLFAELFKEHLYYTGSGR